MPYSCHGKAATGRSPVIDSTGDTALGQVVTADYAGHRCPLRPRPAGGVAVALIGDRGGHSLRAAHTAVRNRTRRRPMFALSLLHPPRRSGRDAVIVAPSRVPLVHTIAR